VVSSLLGLHAMKVRDTAQGEVLDDCRNRIRAMSLIHERLYTAGQFARIAFGEYLSDMVRNILASSVDAASRVRLVLRMQPIEVNLDVAVPLSLIASELVLNALKHAFADGRPGTLTITLQSGPEMHELFMQDDGRGLPENFSPAASTGIGIELMDSLTRQIRGHWAFVPSPVGTTVVVRWPVPEPSVFPMVPAAPISSENPPTH
jgi:two-component sensor histidine kinase